MAEVEADSAAASPLAALVSADPEVSANVLAASRKLSPF